MCTRFVRIALLAVAPIVWFGCGGGSGGEKGGAPAGSGKMGTASVSGMVRFKGSAPKLGKIQMAADPICKAQHAKPVEADEVIVNPNQTLKNVFVYVKEGAEAYTAPKDPVVLDQVGCLYEPHVLGVQVGQPVEIKNSDPTLHNVHALPQINEGFNFGQANKGMTTTKTFSKPEVMIPVKCDVHSWMKSYIGVVNHPFYSVTGSDGSFSLKGLPAGTYTVEAWHEKYGTQTAQVTVADGESKTLEFTFAAK